ncbi:MAG: malonyl-CoA synthase [Defluviimonas sp.]|nr:malonyl-CoA synthase [Paracoccaceae bacterium]MCC0062597.1 malonyl-CoA synthase [Defluviimonas sp.]
MANHLYDGLFARHEGSTRDFLILPDGTRVSHAAFLDRAARYAGALAAAGLVPGDRVALQLEKSVDMLAVIAGAIRAGIVFLPLNPAYTSAEVSYFVSDAGAKLLLCDGRNEPALAPVAEAAGAALLTVNADGSGSFADRARTATAAPIAPRQPGDLAALLYTSGTTGRSKGAMMSHANLRSNAEVLVDYWRFDDRDVLLHALPIFHTHGLFVATNVALMAGCPMIFLPRFDTETVLRHLPQATAMMGVPTFYTRLLDDPRLTRDCVAGMRLFISGSAPLLAETHRLWEDRTGHRILERYGMTETNMNSSNPYEGERRAGTVGFPLPGIELKVCDAEGHELPRGEIGTLEVRGPNVFQGYWNMPAKTAEELRPDGFFITGDLGLIDAAGYVTIVGRGKDLIISGGFNVYPKEVEMALDDLPGVHESAVIGAPHPDFGEAVVAVVVPQPGTTPDRHALRAALDTRLARFKQPKLIAFRADLPRNTMGKVQKALLRDEFRESFTGSGAEPA